MWLVEKNIQFFFQNLKKLEAVQNQIRNILIGNIEENKKRILTINYIYIIKISSMRGSTYQNMI